MTRPRSEQICLNTTAFYHCTTRCVRKAFLCGKTNNKSYEHRRKWLEDKIIEKSQHFMIDIVSYAIMHNHYHVIVSINKSAALNLTNKEVVERWHKLYCGTPLSQAFISGDELTYKQHQILQRTIRNWRERLYSLSWFMRSINEPISRKANKEDNCRGKFWEGRFKSQALLDEKALLACMAYVDLNPIRAKIATTLENSDHTSVKKRLELNGCIKKGSITNLDALDYDIVLMPFSDTVKNQNSDFLPIKFKDYIELVDWSGRQILSPSKGSISGPKPKLIETYDISFESWCDLSQNFSNSFKLFIGSLGSLQKIGDYLGMKRIGGRPACFKLFGPD